MRIAHIDKDITMKNYIGITKRHIIESKKVKKFNPMLNEYSVKQYLISLIFILEKLIMLYDLLKTYLTRKEYVVNKI